jgi:membrane-bound ClpP family serine protease
MNLPTIEDMMGLLLFALGFILMMIAFFSVLGATGLVDGGTIWVFFIFGFVLCLTGYIMSRSVTGGMFNPRDRER